MPDVYDPTLRRERARASRWWALPGALVVILATPAFAVCVALGMPGTGGFLLLWITLGAWSTQVRGALPAALTTALPLLGAVYWTVPFAELDRACQDTVAAHRAGTGPTDRTLDGWVAVHGAMIAGGWLLGLTEVATEAWELHREDPAERGWDSDFALDDPLVRDAVRAMFADAASGRIDPRTLTWAEYGALDDSLAVSLALNCPLQLTAAVALPGPDPLLRFQARCKVDYPAHAPRVLVRTALHRYALDEGVFDVLEQRGRLTPYTAVWSFELRSSDPRLADRDTAHRRPGEHLARAVAALLAGDR